MNTNKSTHPRALAAEVGEQIDGRGVRPVQIVEEQEQRPQARHLLQEGAQLALQALLGGRFRLGEHAGQGGVFRGRRHDLRVPVRGGRLHHPGRRLAAVAVEQALQGLEKRQIGLGPGEALRAAPARQSARAAGGRQLAEEVFDQGRLADAGLAGHAQEQPLTRRGRLEGRPSSASSFWRPTE